MSTKGSIGALNTLKELYANGRLGDPRVQFVEKIDYAIKHIEEGEKYKKMWRELESIVRSGDIFTLLPNDIENRGLHITAILKAFLSIEQKYFPEMVKKTITIEIEAKDESLWNWFNNYITEVIFDGAKKQNGNIKVKFKECD